MRSRYVKDTNITIDNIKLENVNRFTYLGSKITSDGKNTTDISSKLNRHSLKRKKNYSPLKR